MARTFPTNSDYINISMPSGLLGATYYSIACWIYPTSNSSIVAFNIRETGGGGNDVYQFFLTATDGDWRTRVDPSEPSAHVIVNIAYSSKIILLHRWSHYASVWSSGTLKIYIDGILRNQGSAGASTISTALNLGPRFGNWALTPANAWLGGLHDIFGGPFALTDGQVLRLARGARPWEIGVNPDFVLLHDDRVPTDRMGKVTVTTTGNLGVFSNPPRRRVTRVFPYEPATSTLEERNRLRSYWPWFAPMGLAPEVT